MDKKRDVQMRNRSKVKSCYSTLLQNQNQDAGNCQSLSNRYSTSTLQHEEKATPDDTFLGKDSKRDVFVRSVTSTIDCYPSSSRDKPEMKHHLEEVFIMPSKQNHVIE